MASINDTRDPFSANFSAQTSLPHYVLVAVAVSNAWVFVQGVVGNILVILVLLRKRIYMDSTDTYLLSLSTADLLILLLCQPTALVEFYAEDEWYFGEVLCRLVPFVSNCVCTGSVLSILAISWERYHAIRFPLKSHRKQAVKTTVFILSILWFIAGIVSVPFGVLPFVENSRLYDGRTISVCRTAIVKTWQKVYIISMFVTFYITPLFVTAVMYRQMCCTLKSSFRTDLHHAGDDVTNRVRRRHHQVVRMFAAVILIFFICLLPFRTFSLWVVFAHKDTVENLGHERFANLLWFSRIMFYLNSAINPIIYNAFSSKFRRAFNSMICGQHYRQRGELV